MAYRATINGLNDKEWVAGTFWWKWPANLDYGGPRNRGFTPKGKPAEQILEDWFQQKATQ